MADNCKEIGSLENLRRRLIFTDLALAVYLLLLVSGTATVIWLLIAPMLGLLWLRAIWTQERDEALLLTNKLAGTLAAQTSAISPSSINLPALASQSMQENHELRQAAKKLQNESRRLQRDLQETLEAVALQNIELDLAKQAAETAATNRAEFLASTSHDIRTPLNGIIGFCQLLGQTELSATQQDHLNIVHDSANDLLRRVDDILDLEKIDSGKLELECLAVNLFELLEDCLCSLAPVRSNSELILSLHYATDVAEILELDPLRIKQVMLNLIHNALKFTQYGHVSVSARMRDSELVLAVSDSGIGMNRAQKKALFKPFEQTDSSISRRFGGSGLGLTITKRLLKAMGSNIEVRSSPGHGSHFEFTLPVNVVQQHSDYPAISQNQVYLLLEQVDLRQSIFALCQRFGARVTVFESFTTLARTLQRKNADDGGDTTLILQGFDKHGNNAALSKLSTHNRKLQILCLAARKDQTALNPDIDFLELPLRRMQLYERLRAQTKKRPRSQAMAPSQIGQGVQFSALVVDDNPANRKLLGILLEQHGVRAQYATSGEQALAVMTQSACDIVFMDLRLPRMSGSAAATILRQRVPQLPIIAVTAHTGHDHVNLPPAIDALLLKPVMLEKLKVVLEKYLHGSLQTTSAIAEAGLATLPEVSNFPNLSNLHTSDRHTSPIDVRQSLQLAGGKADLATSSLRALLQSLQPMQAQLLRAWENGQLNTLHDTVHKLHGAACYTGVPQLKSACHRAEAEIVRTGKIPATALRAVLNASKELQSWHEHHSVAALFE